MHCTRAAFSSPPWLETGMLPWMWWKCVWIFKGLLHLLCDHWVLFQFAKTASSNTMQLKISSVTNSRATPTPNRRLYWGKECFCYMRRLKVIERQTDPDLGELEETKNRDCGVGIHTVAHATWVNRQSCPIVAWQVSKYLISTTNCPRFVSNELCILWSTRTARFRSARDVWIQEWKTWKRSGKWQMGICS